MIFHNLQFLKNLCKVDCLISVHSTTICLVSAMCQALFLTYQPLGECVNSYSPSCRAEMAPEECWESWLCISVGTSYHVLCEGCLVELKLFL